MTGIEAVRTNSSRQPERSREHIILNSTDNDEKVDIRYTNLLTAL